LLGNGLFLFVFILALTINGDLTLECILLCGSRLYCLGVVSFCFLVTYLLQCHQNFLFKKWPVQEELLRYL